MVNNNTKWIFIAVIALILVGALVQKHYDIPFSIIPADGPHTMANQQCTFIADLDYRYHTSWNCLDFGGASWIAYDINNDGIKEKFGAWYAYSQNQGDSCNSNYPDAAVLTIPGIDQVQVRYGKERDDSATAKNKLVICCGQKAWGYEEGRGQYASAITTCNNYTPTTCTSNWIYGAWSECINSIQTRSASDYNNCNPPTSQPILQQACTLLPQCTQANFQYSYLPSTCPSSGQWTKTWTQVGNCEGGYQRPSNTVESCTYNPGVQSCTYTYSAWGNCQPSNTRSRIVLTATPSGCQGTPTLTEACTYISPNGNGETNVCKDSEYSFFGSCVSKTMVWIILIAILGLIIFVVVKGK